MTYRWKNSRKLVSVLIVVAFFLPPFAFLSIDDITISEDAQAPLALSLTDVHRNLVNSMGNANLLFAEDIASQEGCNGRRVPEIKRVSRAMLLCDSLCGKKFVSINKLTDIFPVRKFNRHVIIPYSTHAPPQAWSRLSYRHVPEYRK